jgi:hypothetical protein
VERLRVCFHNVFGGGDLLDLAVVGCPSHPPGQIPSVAVATLTALDPLLPLKTGPVNETKARESGP